MHYTSPAHPQEKKQEYHIDYPQRLVDISTLGMELTLTIDIDIDILQSYLLELQLLVLVKQFNCTLYMH